MGGLEALGPAAVDDATLAAMVADHLGIEGPARVEDVEVTEFPYALEAITTASRHLVRGRVRSSAGERGFGLFVKVLRSFESSPMAAQIPEHLRAHAAASIPWRTEPAAYRSDLADRLPDGLTMPRALAVRDLDQHSSAIWLEELDVVPVAWDQERSCLAARLLGRMSASAALAPLAGLSGMDWSLRTYLEGRLAHQVLPMLRDDGIWRHPLVAGAFDAQLRERLRTAGERAGELVEEALSLPHLPAHGDACPNNLLTVTGVPGFVLVDYGFWMPMPVGADLGQLLVGEVQLGRSRAENLGERDAAHLAAYVAGLREEGCDIPAEVVARAHALHLLVMTGLSCLPWEHLGAPPSPELAVLAADRAAIARFCLDRVDATTARAAGGVTMET